MPRDFRLNPPATVSIEVFDYGRDVNGNATAHHLILWSNGKEGAESQGGQYRTKRRGQVGFIRGYSEAAIADLADLFPRAVWRIVPKSKEGDRAGNSSRFEMARDYEQEPHPVIFRAVKSGEYKGNVDAFFPTQAGTNDPATCGCYAHVGQHCSASKAFYVGTRPATPEEIAPLKMELESIGYVLEVHKRWLPEFDEIRFARMDGRDE